MRGAWALPVAGLAIVAAGALIVGAGDHLRPDAHCLPDLPRQTVRAGGDVVMPLPEGSYSVSSPFGAREGGWHNGVDFAAPEGTPILAAVGGLVVAAGPASGFGNWIVVDSQRPQGLVSTVYGHMYDSGVAVHTGDTVTAGQPIGAVGMAGEATGPHLHFEVVPGGRLQGGTAIDPEPWLAAAVHTDSVVPAAVASANAVPHSSRLRARSAPAGMAAGCDPVQQSDGEPLRAGTVPPEYEVWIRKAATAFCPDLSAPLLAAQLRQESGFNRFARSPAGALGPAQFMPDTWRSLPGIDGDGDGQADITSVADAVMSQAKYACNLIAIAKSGLAQGTLHGDLTELWLSMYNCGPDGTLAQGQVCQNSETLGYVKAIPKLAADYTDSAGRLS